MTEKKEFIKDFDGWHPVKKSIDKKRNPPSFKEREIRWCSIGVNVGFEIVGKDQVFTRPVLIVRRFSPFTFLGVPMTTSTQKGYFRYPYNVKGKDGYLLIDQTRTYDSRRLGDLMMTVPDNQFEKIKRAMKARFNL